MSFPLNPAVRSLSPQVSKTLTNTFITLSAMLLITAVTAYLTKDLKLSVLAFGAIIIASIGILFTLQRYKNSALGLLILAVFSTLIGVSLGPTIGHYTSISGGSQLIAFAAGLSGAVCAGCAAWVKITGKRYSHMSTFLLASTLALLVGYVVSWFVAMPALVMGLSVIGVIIFTGWLLVDLGEIINGDETNYISAAAGIYLSIINLFQSFLTLLGIGLDD